ncbi:MAG: SDR family oxidoreductase [Akkermansiaceae bacterium]|nr:SDR family oxidoreductase [Akkermansiaceae bacterium]
MNLGLEDKVVIVTGGSKGIGAACVELFAEEGAIPVIVGRSPEVGKALIEKVGRGSVIQAELTSEEACENAIAKTIKEYGRIDGLVHNAGINDQVSLRDGVEAFKGSLQKNLIHLYALTHHALESLIASKGFIVNVTSKVAVTGQGGTSGYAASKGAMNALTREWALDLAKHGIRVNSVVPAEVYTPMYEGLAAAEKDPQKFLDDMSSVIPLGKRMTTAEEMANAVVFLASERSSHTTGQIIYPDGGYVHLDRSYHPEG